MRSALAIFSVLALPGLALAQGNRSEDWEWSVSVPYQESKNMDSGGGSTLDLDSAFGIGFNIAYNVSNNLLFGMDLDYLSPDYRATLIDDTVSPADSTVINHELTQWNFRFKGTYSFGERPLQPFVEAGLGWTYVDSNVADGDPIIGCWWHPWWGYICDGFYNTFDDTSFTYGAGAGLRFNLRGGSFLKASYSVWELDGVGGVGDSSLSAARLEFGWTF